MSHVIGKFFAEYITKYLPSWKFQSQTTTETWIRMEQLFAEEFPGGEVNYYISIVFHTFEYLNTYYLFYFYQVINFPEARAGHEEELVKMVSLMMYLGTVKYPNSTLSGTLADCKLFSKEVQLRVKCVLQVFIDQNNS